MLCKDCEHFKILYWPVKYLEPGRAECTKHDLITDFNSMRKFSKLECVETERGEEQDEQNG